jgi:hypothetical protein
MSGVERMPLSARDAEATDTLASRATVVIVGATSVLGCGSLLEMISEKVY